MVIVIAVLIALVLLGAALAGVGRFGEMPDAIVDEFAGRPITGPLTPQDLDAAQFGTAYPGYNRAQVDRLLAEAARSWRGTSTPME